jgi:hypothetical protein
MLMVSALRITTFCAALALAAFLTPLQAYSADDPVNYDDPNLAVTTEFAGDLATTCHPDLPPKELSRCLREKGLTAPQGVALVPPTQASAPETR